jgi:SAM-dependent methyltransferase
LRPKPSPLRYWEKRAERYGARSVVHIGLPEDELAAVTEKQKQILLPLFRAQLRGDEKRVLDFGCGAGRFTADLARLASARAVGLDPTARLLSLAPSSACASYLRARGTQIPALTDAFDAVWVCQVLGGIVGDRDVAASAAEIQRVLKPDGLLFLVENTSDKPDGDYWRYRSLRFYRDLFCAYPLVHLADYDDRGECNSVLGGRIDDGRINE